MEQIKKYIIEKLHLDKNTSVEINDIDEFMSINNCTLIRDKKDELQKEYSMSNEFIDSLINFFTKEQKILSKDDCLKLAGEIRKDTLNYKYNIKIKTWQQTSTTLEAIYIRLFYDSNMTHCLLFVIIDFEDQTISWMQGNKITENDKKQLSNYSKQMIHVLQYMIK